MKTQLLRSNVTKRKLINTYRKFSKIGIVTGAGVSATSGIRTYEKLVLRLLEISTEKRLLDESLTWVPSFVERQKKLIEAEDKKTIPPDEIVLFLKKNIVNHGYPFQQLLRVALYEDVDVKKTVLRRAFEKNITLNALLTFCAAKQYSAVAPDSYPNRKHNSPVEVNNKIAGILTTNYDNLLEGAFHTKYRVKLLRPIGRPKSLEDYKDRKIIPVYHNHGYIDYRKPKDEKNDLQNPSIIISEDDYFNRFYDALGFGNYISLNFLRRYPCLFIGTAMTDKNLRRYLYHLIKEPGGQGEHQRKFAILNINEISEPEYTDSLLSTYGVDTIWIDKFEEIETILKDLYISIDGIDQNDWEYLKDYTWPKTAKKKSTSKENSKK